MDIITQKALIEGSKKVFGSPNTKFTLTNVTKKLRDTGEGIGATLVSPLTGATDELAKSARNAGSAVIETSYGFGKGIEQLGASTGTAITSIGKGTGSALAEVGAGGGRAVSSFGVGLLPVAAVAVIVIIGISLAKKV